MTTAHYLFNAQVLRPRVGVVATALLIQDGRIAALDPSADRIPATAQRLDAGGRLLTPGLIDLHTHGIERYAYESGPEALAAGLACPPRYGVTTVLPTLYSRLNRESLDFLRSLSRVLTEEAATSVPGFHLEGPFLALPGAGAATIPGDLDLLAALYDALEDRVAAVSVSGDTPDILPVIAELKRRGTIILMTHTRATYEQAQAAIDAGVTHATHFYDVFPIPEATEGGVRQVGAVEAALADERMSVDFICDGVHVHPVAVRAALKAKGPQRVLLITDSNVGAGLPAGHYDTPMGFAVRVAPGDAARIHGGPKDGALAGSALTSEVGIANLMRWADELSEADVWSMGSRSVAERLNLSDRGDIAIGLRADLVLWDEQGTRSTWRSDEPGVSYHAWKTWTGGRLVFDRAAEECDA